MEPITRKLSLRSQSQCKAMTLTLIFRGSLLLLEGMSLGFRGLFPVLGLIFES